MLKCRALCHRPRLFLRGARAVTLCLFSLMQKLVDSNQIYKRYLFGIMTEAE
ncbi:unnamed protein product [Ciceribacter sp. T2.26MG-112.2]|nr:unnamed protein product [Ciceribacter naphthalenivorans]